MPGSSRRSAFGKSCADSAVTRPATGQHAAPAAGQTLALSVLTAFGDGATSAAARAENATEAANLVSVIEADVIPRLLLLHRLGWNDGEDERNTSRPAGLSVARTGRKPAAVPAETREPARRPPVMAPPRLTGKEVADLIELVRHDAVDAGLRYVKALRQRGHLDEELFTMLLAPAARQLGEMWVSDDVTFLDVTLAVSRLQRLLFELCQTSDAVDSGAPSVLLSVTPGEQHTLGMHMAACAFRRAGARVVCLLPSTLAEIEATVRKERFDMVGFSLGSECRLDLLAGVIEATRVAARQSTVRIVVGGPAVPLNGQVARLSGADRAVNDVTEALAMLVESRVN